jgi:hypothetical protein
MSEEDYQRGLRGGDCPVSTHDWERWSDWKAGNREYERRQEAEARAFLLETMTPAERQVWSDQQWALLKAEESIEEANTAKRKSAEEAAVAVVEQAMKTWAEDWLTKRRQKEAQGFLERITRPINLPRTMWIGLTRWTTSGNGSWRQQPSLGIADTNYQFDTPHEYIAAFRFLKVTKAPVCDQAIAALQQVAHEDWTFPSLEASQRRLRDVAAEAEAIVERNYHEALKAPMSPTDTAAAAAIMVPINECKRLRELEKQEPDFCGWALSSWTAANGEWVEQPVIKVCGPTEFRFATLNEYIAAMLQMLTVWKKPDDQARLRRLLSGLQEQRIVWDRHASLMSSTNTTPQTSLNGARWWSSKPVIAVGAALLGVLGSSIALKVSDANRDSVAHAPSATKAADSAHVDGVSANSDRKTAVRVVTDDADPLRAAQRRLAWADSFWQAHPERLRIYGQRDRQLFEIKDTSHWPDVESTYNVLLDSANRPVLHVEVPFSVSGDWYAAYSHYFDEQGHTIVFESQASWFNNVCTDLLRRQLRMFFDVRFRLMKADTSYEDADNQALDRSCEDPFELSTTPRASYSALVRDGKAPASPR